MPASAEVLDYLTTMYPWLDQYLVSDGEGTAFVDPKNNETVLKGIAFGLEGGKPKDLPQEVKDRREAQAQELGREVPDWAVKEALLTPQLLFHFASICDDISLNIRSHGLFGPPGTGKNFLSALVAGVYHMPYADLSYGQHSFVREDIGDTGLKSEVIRDEQTQEIKGVVPTTVFEEGDLAKMLQAESVTALNEIDEISPQVSLLFDTFGSGVTSERRVIRQNTPMGKEQKQVDPQAIMIATWNEKPETMLNEAFRSRVSMHEFVYEPPQVIGQMLAYSALSALKDNEALSSLRDLSAEQVATLAKDMDWIGDVFQKMQNVHRTEQFQYPITFTPRTASRMLASVVLAAGKMAENSIQATAGDFGKEHQGGFLKKILKSDLERMLEGFDTTRAARVMESKMLEDLEPFVVAPPDGSGAMGAPTVSSETMADLAREDALIRQLLSDVLPELPQLAKEVAKLHFRHELKGHGVEVKPEEIDAAIDSVAQERDQRRARNAKIKHAAVEAGVAVGAAAGAPLSPELSSLDDPAAGEGSISADYDLDYGA